MNNNLTDKNLFKSILGFSLPFLLSYFLQTLYGMADLYIIGQYEGAASTTAVSVGSQVMHMLTVMIVGLAMGSTVSIGQSVGANDKNRAAAFIGNTVTLFMLLSLVLAFVLNLSANSIACIMSTPSEALSGTISYLRICFCGIPFITAYNIISSVYRGLGDSKSPMYFIGCACAANIVLDYIFIGAMHLGPSGAALGTTVSQAISVLISLTFIIKKKIGIPLNKNDFLLSKKYILPILKVGIPVSAQDGFIQISFIIITIIANHRGLTDAAAVGIVEKIMSFLFLVPSSMLSTVSALGAQNIGAGKPERAVSTLKYSALFAVVFGILFVIAVNIAAMPIVGLFTADKAVAAAGAAYLLSYVWDSFFGGIQFSFSGYFCACSRSELSFLHNFISIILVRVPGAYFASKYFPDTLFPMGLAPALGSVLSVVICVILFVFVLKCGTAVSKIKNE